MRVAGIACPELACGELVELVEVARISTWRDDLRVVHFGKVL